MKGAVYSQLAIALLAVSFQASALTSEEIGVLTQNVNQACPQAWENLDTEINANTVASDPWSGNTGDKDVFTGFVQSQLGENAPDTATLNAMAADTASVAAECAVHRINLINALASNAPNEAQLVLERISQNVGPQRLGESMTFTYTGGDQPFIIPDNVYEIDVHAWGAGGGSGLRNYEAGNGGYTFATLSVTPGEAYNVVVGQAGVDANTSIGYGGGGPTAATYVAASGLVQSGGTGGGLSGLLSGSESLDYSTAQARALVIAGGGGGGKGGDGGAAIGAEGDTDNTGKGGTQTSGGAAASWTGEFHLYYRGHSARRFCQSVGAGNSRHCISGRHRGKIYKRG